MSACPFLCNVAHLFRIRKIHISEGKIIEHDKIQTQLDELFKHLELQNLALSQQYSQQRAPSLKFY